MSNYKFLQGLLLNFELLICYACQISQIPWQNNRENQNGKVRSWILTAAIFKIMRKFMFTQYYLEDFE